MEGGHVDVHRYLPSCSARWGLFRKIRCLISAQKANVKQSTSQRHSRSSSVGLFDVLVDHLNRFWSTWRPLTFMSQIENNVLRDEYEAINSIYDSDTVSVTSQAGSTTFAVLKFPLHPFSFLLSFD